ncbi:MAG: MarR family transcriptional regulator, partial [Candidatus Omnitrophica bacterium]|nr:MarR family transcriptional regulator [Candidatus Omnitrophota bacterium]
LRVLNVLAQKPVISASAIRKATGLSLSTIFKVLDGMTERGLVKELTGQKRNRLFSYEQYLKILSEDTEPLA